VILATWLPDRISEAQECEFSLHDITTKHLRYYDDPIRILELDDVTLRAG
jgi:hypothetical protein